MTLGFGKIIQTIEAEISDEYMPGAIGWADNTFKNAWSNAIDRFDHALASGDYTRAKLEGEFYLDTVFNLIRKYKKHKHLDDTVTFLESIGGFDGSKLESA